MERIKETGRPLMYKSSEEMQEKIDEYFAFCEEKERYESITGLCYYLGFVSRQSFYDYEKFPEFTYVVKRARLRIEMHYEDRLNSQVCTGAIFALKNMGWKDDKTIAFDGEANEIKHTVKFVGSEEDKGDDES